MQTMAMLRVLSVLLLALSLTGPAEAAEAFKTYSAKADYDDVRFELTEAIVSRGLKVDSNGHVADMLKRTGADVGSTKPIYRHGEYFIFCSAKLSREMMEADPALIGLCPFTLFIYETEAEAGKITVGYRRMPKGENDRTSKALTAVENLLDGIARQAVQ